MLEKILERKRQEIAQAKRRLPLEALKERVSHHAQERNFRQAIQQEGRITLIAELKRKSPSKGMLRERFDPVSLAQTMEDARASALSVLTDEPFFGGHLEFLRDVKQFTELPALRKDFLIDPYQVYESALYQADAALLIVRILGDPLLQELLKISHVFGIESLVEVHSEDDLSRAIQAGAQVIGINHRDLETFQMDAHLSERLMARMPSGKVVVAESNIQCAEDVLRMKRLGVHAVLVGEALMTAPDVSEKIRELFSGVWDEGSGT